MAHSAQRHQGGAVGPKPTRRDSRGAECAVGLIPPRKAGYFWQSGVKKILATFACFPHLARKIQATELMQRVEAPCCR